MSQEHHFGLILKALQLWDSELPLDQYKSIALPAMKPGEYAFNCQMQMYRGTVIVE